MWQNYILQQENLVLLQFEGKCHIPRRPIDKDVFMLKPESLVMLQLMLLVHFVEFFSYSLD